MIRRLVFFFCFFFLIPQTVFAHVPRIVTNNSSVTVSDPDISQAFYGQLNNMPRVFSISITKPLSLYLNLLTPANNHVPFSAKVFRVDSNIKKELISLEGEASSSAWTPYYEEFGGDHYMKGPEITQNLLPGNYEILIYNSENNNPFVLAIGTKERFTLPDTLNSIITIPQLKTNYFNSPLYTFALTPIGLPVIILCVIIGIITSIFVRYEYYVLNKKKQFKKNLSNREVYLRYVLATISLITGIYFWFPILFVFTGYLLWETIIRWCILKTISKN